VSTSRTSVEVAGYLGGRLGLLFLLSERRGEADTEDVRD
jgi:hypothetical protein